MMWGDEYESHSYTRLVLFATRRSNCAGLGVRVRHHAPEMAGDSYPDAIAAQCERAKAQAIRQYGQPPLPVLER